MSYFFVYSFTVSYRKTFRRKAKKKNLRSSLERSSSTGNACLYVLYNKLELRNRKQRLESQLIENQAAI